MPADRPPRFELHPRLERDTLPLGRVRGARLRLMDDARFIWVMLVPEQPGVTELHQLGPDALQTLMLGCTRVAERLAREFGAARMNVAALGNVVAQLHVHVVVRHEDDPAWPGPVWGHGTAVPYREPQRTQVLERLSRALDGLLTVP